MAENIVFKTDDDDLAKEAVSLLAINEEDNEFVDLLISSDNEWEEVDVEGVFAQ